MSSNVYDRSSFPHEDDVAFERVLRNISRQEVMPRPIVAGPTEVRKTDFRAFFGDTYHWDNFSLNNWIYLISKYFMSLVGVST